MWFYNYTHINCYFNPFCCDSNINSLAIFVFSVCYIIIKAYLDVGIFIYASSLIVIFLNKTNNERVINCNCNGSFRMTLAGIV